MGGRKGGVRKARANGRIYRSRACLVEAGGWGMMGPGKPGRWLGPRARTHIDPIQEVFVGQYDVLAEVPLGK